MRRAATGGAHVRPPVTRQQQVGSTANSTRMEAAAATDAQRTGLSTSSHGVRLREDAVRAGK